MYKYFKKLNYPVNVRKKDLRMAKYLITQLGGPAGELGAALRYFSQKFAMPDETGQALLNDIACEELGHCEMIGTMFRQLIKDASLDDEARRYFKLIEDGDTESNELFEFFKQITLEEVGKIYELLNVSFDSYAGESFITTKCRPLLMNLMKRV